MANCGQAANVGSTSSARCAGRRQRFCHVSQSRDGVGQCLELLQRLEERIRHALQVVADREANPPLRQGRQHRSRRSAYRPQFSPRTCTHCCKTVISTAAAVRASGDARAWAACAPLSRLPSRDTRARTDAGVFKRYREYTARRRASLLRRCVKQTRRISSHSSMGST